MWVCVCLCRWLRGRQRGLVGRTVWGGGRERKGKESMRPLSAATTSTFITTTIEKTGDRLGLVLARLIKKDRMQIQHLLHVESPDVNPAAMCDPPICDGDIIQSVNGINCTSSDHTITLLKEATGRIELVLERLVTLEANEEGSNA